MNSPDAVAALESSTFGSGFTRSELETLAADARWRRYAPAGVIFREGDRSDAFFVVHHGHVGLDMSLPARASVRILTLGPGDVLAWSALVGDGVMTASATALDDVELVELSAAALTSLCRTDPPLGFKLMRSLAAALAKRLLATRLQLLDLFAADAAGAAR